MSLRQLIGWHLQQCTEVSAPSNYLENADVVTIHKQEKDPMFPQNQWLTSLLCCLWKMYEKIVWTNEEIRLHQRRDTRWAIQFYYRLLYGSPIDQIDAECYLWLREKKATIAVNESYDSMWYTGFFYKLISINPPGELISVIDSFIAQRSFWIKIDCAFSRRRPIFTSHSGIITFSVAVQYVHLGHPQYYRIRISFVSWWHMYLWPNNSQSMHT